MEYIMTDRMKELNEAAYLLEEQLELARAAVPRGTKYETPERDEVRRIRRKLSIIDSEIYSISLVINKVWHEQKCRFNIQGVSPTVKEINTINMVTR